MRILVSACVIALAGAFGLPATAQTVIDEAQCADAKGSSDQNAIRQFRPVADWPQTVEPDLQTWIMEQKVPDVAYDGQLVVGEPLPETVEIMEVPKFTQYRWAYLGGKRVLVVPENRRVIAVY